jgi:hypothetical protein
MNQRMSSKYVYGQEPVSIFSTSVFPPSPPSIHPSPFYSDFASSELVEGRIPTSTFYNSHPVLFQYFLQAFF